MAQVHTFTLLTELFSDTRLPLQYPGGGNPPATRQVEMTLLLEYIAEQLLLGTPAVLVETGNTIVVTGGTLIQCIAVEADPVGDRTIKIGTSAGADDILEETTIPDDVDFSYTLNRYTSTTLTMHFTLTGGDASVLVFKSYKSA